jgi:hypothetical protein
MEIRSISDIKKELKELSKEELIQLCFSLGKYKNDNKAYLNYLLFDAHDPESFIAAAKTEMDELFKEITQTNLYLVKKSLRKILRIIGRYAKYTGSKEKEAELTIYFLQKMKHADFQWQRNKVLVNLYNTQVKRLQSAISKLHEDLQYDLQREIETLLN